MPRAVLGAEELSRALAELPIAFGPFARRETIGRTVIVLPPQAPRSGARSEP